MGLFFRKSIRLAPGIRLNLSKRGAGVSAGPRGAKVGVGPSGRRLAFSWKGLQWRRRV
jgi:hypothetical protein